MTTLQVADHADAIGIDAMAAAGLADVQHVFDEAMARLAVISDGWQQRSSEALQQTAPPSAALVADSAPTAQAA